MLCKIKIAIRVITIQGTIQEDPNLGSRTSLRTSLALEANQIGSGGKPVHEPVLFQLWRDHK